ncbi:SDR family NAD(P)-dependent oxidoreductase [Terricaulis silvestris]|uniref:Gluconate 5-dehydrogenase n=1 Tax=Terricaulis silvestris TaxID=2686094 RepID=A0A6I6MUL6_9CAUL|nr:SDR family oxidoreductase [Terricaulis silvestris]QGZ96154.1 Gluconate 5-dehydrogenase [Terricaulis silvestris]
MAELAGMHVLVVGGDEIGRGIAKRFTREGASVSLADAMDNAAPNALDILVLNILGAPNLAPLETQSPAAFDAALQRVVACARMMQAAAPAMRARGGGRIILIGHRYGETVGEGIGAYNAAAYALVGLTRTAAIEWGKWGITTNLLLPFADTSELRAAREKRPKIIDLFTGQVPLRRAGDPVEDIGGAALFLASADSAFVNGQIVHADGGQHIAAPVLNPIKYAT